MNQARRGTGDVDLTAAVAFLHSRPAEPEARGCGLHPASPSFKPLDLEQLLSLLFCVSGHDAASSSRPAMSVSLELDVNAVPACWARGALWAGRPQRRCWVLLSTPVPFLMACPLSRG